MNWWTKLFTREPIDMSNPQEIEELEQRVEELEKRVEYVERRDQLLRRRFISKIVKETTI